MRKYEWEESEWKAKENKQKVDWEKRSLRDAGNNLTVGFEAVFLSSQSSEPILFSVESKITRY